jgi:hypothetical protein
LLTYLQHTYRPRRSLTQPLSTTTPRTAATTKKEKRTCYDLLEQQGDQRITASPSTPLSMLARAAKFERPPGGAVSVKPNVRVSKLVNLGDHIGPVLRDELHATPPEQFFGVRRKRPDAGGRHAVSA